MDIFVVGSGGREHAMAWALAKGGHRLTCAPGNGGMAQIAEIVPIAANDIAGLIAHAKDTKPDLVIIGPEEPLILGLADAMRAEGFLTVGPSADAAQIEGSKAFTKALCDAHNIPTASYGRFKDLPSALAYIGSHELPLVVKADGIAAGKGVIIAETKKEAIDAVREMFAGRFGEAGSTVVIEEFLEGEEASFFALVHGRDVVALAGAQDHKRAFDGETGPNTGGMGAYSPAPVMDLAMATTVMGRIIAPTALALDGMGCPFSGILYAGLMITEDGPKLIEYNARFGDPEAQVLLPRLTSDFAEMMLALAQGRIAGLTPQWSDQTALTVAMAAKGYPGAYEKGSEIKGLDAAGSDPNVTVFHAGTKREGASVFASGGRVLNVTALGADVAQAQERAYAAVDKIEWPEGFCRRDIGWRALSR